MIGRRRFLASFVFAGSLSCSRRERAAIVDLAAPANAPLPQMPLPEAGESAATRTRGQVGTQSWTFDGGGRAVVVVPSWTKATERLPVLIALHGRGEANKGPALGVMGWPRDYGLLRAIERLCAPPLTGADYQGFFDAARLAETNTSLATNPFKGLIVVCPYLPDVDLHKATGPVKDYARYLFDSVLPRVRAELPALSSPAATGIDGVSLGGAVSLRVGTSHAEAFGAVGSLQAALGEDQVPEFTHLAQLARARNPDLKLRLLTSSEDYFHDAIAHTSLAWKKAGIPHDYADVPGPHDYPFNRGPGAIEMLLWHDRVLARG